MRKDIIAGSLQKASLVPENKGVSHVSIVPMNKYHLCYLLIVLSYNFNKLCISYSFKMGNRLILDAH